MLNILSYVGMNLQSEVCLWTLLGLLRTIFDATLFKVNANLKQVWQMKMPVEMSLPVQRALRTMISGVMLVQCFTVYVYLASYIVLLYPVFLEERPTLVLPWLLLAAVRNLLCELTSLALGLGTCVLLGPARPPCIRFLIIKLATIMPAFYMWVLVFGYYHALKMASAFKTFPVVLPAKDLDYGLELAVRRRRTKSLQDEGQLRKRLIASLYAHQTPLTDTVMNAIQQSSNKIEESENNSPIGSNEDIKSRIDPMYPKSVMSNRTISDIGTYEDWFGSEVVVPRDTDRILEQFVLMLLRISAYIKKEDAEPLRLFNSNSQAVASSRNKVECTAMPSEETDTPPIVGSSHGKIASYLRDYPQIFQKKPSDILNTFNLPENRLPTVQSSLSSQSSKSIQEVSIVSTVPTFKIKLSETILNHTLIHSQEELTNQYYSNNNKEIKNIDNLNEKINEPLTNNLKIDSATSIESIINRTKRLTSLKVLREDQTKVRRCAVSNNKAIHISKYKRKPSTSTNNNNDLNTQRPSRSISKFSKNCNKCRKP